MLTEERTLWSKGAVFHRVHNDLNILYILFQIYASLSLKEDKKQLMKFKWNFNPVEELLWRETWRKSMQWWLQSTQNDQ